MRSNPGVILPMTTDPTTTDTVRLYGAAHSLYTGRARSYLIKAGIGYRESGTNTDYFRDTIVPKAGGRLGLPTVELADGWVIRDGAAIIDHFEAAQGHPFRPRTPKQRILSLLFDVIGAEGLLRPAMHYRWNFPDENLALIKRHFEWLMPLVENRAALAEKAANRMRTASEMFGAVPDTFDLVETLYAEVMDRLDAHFAAQPYLLGGKPCIGDFGMIAPLYGHLGRDPKPLSLMQSRASSLFRWVERMNRPETDAWEYSGAFDPPRDDYLPNDDVPGTLIDLLKVLAVDFVPETVAAADFINTWLAEQGDLPAGTEVPRGVGLATFEVRGTQINALAQPYRFYLLKRVQDEYTALVSAERSDVDRMLNACDMAPVLDARLNRSIGRENNLEIWL